MSKIKFRCPCCNYKTFIEKPPGTFDICPVCYWEDDNIQFHNPDFEGGANKISLNEAKKSFLKIGAIDKEFLSYIRKPLEEECD